MATIVLSPDQPISQKAALGAAAAKGLQDISQLLFALQLRRDKLQQESEENRLRQLGISIPFMQMAQAAKRQQETDAIHAKEREEDQAREDARVITDHQNRIAVEQEQARLAEGLLEARAKLFPKSGGGGKADDRTAIERVMEDLAGGNPQKLKKLKRIYFKKQTTARGGQLSAELQLLQSLGLVGLGGAGGAAAGGGGGLPGGGPLTADDYLRGKGLE